MTDSCAIRVPQESVNDETVVLVRWLIPDGTEVEAGTPIVEVETSKALLEIEAPSRGILAHAAEPGTEIAVGAAIGYVSDKLPVHAHDLNGGTSTAEREAKEQRGTQPTTAVSARFSRAARALAQQHGLTEEHFDCGELIRASDVEAVLAIRQLQRAPVTHSHPMLRELDLHGVTMPALGIGEREGVLDAEFLERLGSEAEAIRRLTSEEKCDLYRRNGASIASSVWIGSGTLIRAPRIVLGEQVQLGEDGDIECSESLLIAALSSFRSGLNVRARAVQVGENVFAGERIEISAGTRNPWAILSVGDATFIGDDVLLDVSRPIVIGSESFVTQRTVLITHNIGQSVLEGYENRFAPIVLEDRCQVGMNSTLYAGVRIGSGAIVGSNSFVACAVPAGKMAAGVPARVVRNAARTMTPAQQEQTARQMLREFRELLELRDCAVTMSEDDAFVLRHADEDYLVALRGYGSSPAMAAQSGVLWTLDSRQDRGDGWTVFSLLEKKVSGAGGVVAETSREFLRKRGIRFTPGPWRYREGLI